VNDLTQQASGFRSNRGNFGFLEKKLHVLVCQIGQSSFQPMYSVIVCFVGPSLAKLDSSISETRGSRISRITDETMVADPDGWRTPLVHYLENSGHIADRKVR
jgi:hypothetical protein